MPASRSTATTSCPASSTCTCTASRASTRSTAGDAIAAIAARLPRYGVTAFCPTTVACGPGGAAARARPGAARARDAAAAARACCRRISRATSSIPSTAARSRWRACAPCGGAGAAGRAAERRRVASDSDFTAPTSSPRSTRAAPDVGIVTLAPELDGGLDLIAGSSARGHRVSLGHSGATYEQALGGDRRRRAPRDASLQPHAAARPPRAGAGRRGAADRRSRGGDRSATASTCIRRWFAPAIAAKRPVAHLGDHRRHGRRRPGAGARAHRSAAGRSRPAATRAYSGRRHARRQRADDGPGVPDAGRTASACRSVDAATICATTPARELGLVGSRRPRARNAAADLVVLDAHFAVVQTYVGGQLVYSRDHPSGRERAAGA